MMLGNVRGGGVHIAKAKNNILIVTEGIETALSLKCLYSDKNIVATLSTSGMKNFELPLKQGKLIIGIDNDTAGIKAGGILATRAYANGWHVETIKPPKGRDFNDVLINKNKHRESI